MGNGDADVLRCQGLRNSRWSDKIIPFSWDRMTKGEGRLFWEVTLHGEGVWWVFTADTEATLKRIDVGVYKSTNNNNICNEIEESLDPLNPCSLCGPCPWVIQLEFLSLALSNEGYFNTEKRKTLWFPKVDTILLGSNRPPPPPQVSGSFWCYRCFSVGFAGVSFLFATFLKQLTFWELRNCFCSISF